jgi:hypothetical protein
LDGPFPPLVVEAGIEVHAAGVEPDEERLPIVLGVLHDILRLGDDLAGIEVLHPLLGQQTDVLTALLAHLAEVLVRYDEMTPGGFGSLCKVRR